MDSSAPLSPSTPPIEGATSPFEVALAWLSAMSGGATERAREISAPDIELAWPGCLSRGVLIVPPWWRVRGGKVVLGRVLRGPSGLIAEYADCATEPAQQRIPPAVIAAVRVKNGLVTAASWHVRFEEALDALR